MNPTAPQAVTERYVSNLLHNGRNKEFDICEVQRCSWMVDDQDVGCYFYIKITTATKDRVSDSNGATPAQALRRALEKLGVTFR